MDSVTVRQLLRPLRIAVAVDSGDMAGLVSAAGLNSVLWGGIYNPVVAIDDGDSWRGLVDAFDPDWMINLSSGELPSEMAALFGPRVTSVAELMVPGIQPDKVRLGVGMNILPLIKTLHERSGYLLATGASRAITVTTLSEEWRPYVAVLFGDISASPVLGSEFCQSYRSTLRASELEYDHESPTLAADGVAPIQFTAYEILERGGDAALSRHVIFVGDHESAQDLLAFWNIRASGRDAWFIPVQVYRAHREAVVRMADNGKYRLSEDYWSSANVQKAPSVSDGIFAEVSDWIDTIAGTLPRRLFQPRYGLRSDGFMGDINVASLCAQQGEELAILDGVSLTPVKLISPTSLSEFHWNSAGHFKWAVEIDIDDPWDRNDVMFSYPTSPALEQLVRSSIVSLDEVRLGRNGVVLIQDTPSDWARLRPVLTKDAFAAVFEEAGFESELSQPGRCVNAIIAKLGSLHFGTRVLKLQGVRRMLEILADGGTLTKGDIFKIVCSTEPSETGPNWVPEYYDRLVVSDSQRKPGPNASAVFEELTKKRILRPGLTFRCSHCNTSDWYHVSEFSEEYTCRFCFTEQRVPFGSQANWGYKADGLFRLQDSGFGSIAVILSLWRIAERVRLRDGAWYLSSTEICSVADQWRCELDYAWLIKNRGGDFDLVVGQATTKMPFDAVEVQKMRTLSDRMNRTPYLAFSTLAQRFSQSERELLRSLVQDGHKVIAFTRSDLDPYHSPPMYTEVGRRAGALGGLATLSAGTVEVNLASHE